MLWCGGWPAPWWAKEGYAPPPPFEFISLYVVATAEGLDYNEREGRRRGGREGGGTDMVWEGYGREGAIRGK
jgi:hypothetical protein